VESSKSRFERRWRHVQRWIPLMLVLERDTMITEDEQALPSPSTIAHSLEHARAMRGVENDRFSCSKNLSHSPVFPALARKRTRSVTGGAISRPSRRSTHSNVVGARS